MTLRRIGLPALLAALVAGSGPAGAQDTGDWDFGADPERQLSIAAVTFENFGIAVRCMEGNLSVVLSGLPVASGPRTIRYRLRDEPEADTLWMSGRDSNSAFAVWPRFVATAMSRGGRLALGVPDGDTTRRYVLDIPASADSVARVFRACGHELSLPDQEPAPSGEDFAGLIWRRSPEVNFPGRAQYESGMAAIFCHVRENGRLRDCTVESEFPVGSGFGRAATYGTHRTGQVAPADGSDVSMEGRTIAFVTRYAISDWVAPPPSRLPRQGAPYESPPAEDEAD